MTQDVREPRDVHTWFGLTYASYFVMPRAVLEAMPIEWQYRFTALVNELNAMLDWGDGDYTVQLRDADGRFVRDPLKDYRRPPRIARKVREAG